MADATEFTHDDLVQVLYDGKWYPGWYVAYLRVSECETKFGVGDTVRHVHDGESGVIVSPVNHYGSRPGWLVEWSNTRPCSSPEANLELVSKALQPESLPGGDDCCNRPLADPGFDELAPAAEDAPAPGFDAEVLEAVLMETVEVLAVAEMAAIDAPAACALAVGLASRKLESLIEDAREAIRDAKAAK